MYARSPLTPPRVARCSSPSSSKVIFSSRVPISIAKIIFKGFILQFERDVPIWNNKLLLRKPHLARNDGPISRFRSWFKQFYPTAEEQEVAKVARLDDW
jgi:hypothetical protein